MDFKLAISMASAPMQNLAQIVQQLEEASIDYIHFDIEDGSFVPMMTLGTKIISDLRPLTTLPFEVHLMMINPEWIVGDLVMMGVKRISIHYEACPYPRRTLRQIVSQGAIAGLAFNPSTPIPDLDFLLPYLSFVLILTTEPEYPDAPFLPQVLTKLIRCKEQQGMASIEWVVDGGVNPSNLSLILRAGADMVVVGRSAFKGGNVIRNVTFLREAAS